VLVGALGAYVMVKFFGVIFLGQPRQQTSVEAHDAMLLERVGLGWFAAGCVLLGLFPVNVIRMLDAVDRMLIGSVVGRAGGDWWLLAPVNADRSSYSPLIVLLVIAAIVLLTLQIVHRHYHGRVRTGPAWDCGFPLQTPRMQDTAEGFGQPIRQVFEPFFLMERHLPSPSDAEPRYTVKVSDHLWTGLYLPLAHAVERIAWLVGWIQRGRISVYLTFSFLTLLALLAFVR
jgi:hydrogenase-4 component B